MIDSSHRQYSVCLVLTIEVLGQVFEEERILEYPLNWFDEL